MAKKSLFPPLFLAIFFSSWESPLPKAQALLGFKRELVHLDGHIVTFGMDRGDVPGLGVFCPENLGFWPSIFWRFLSWDGIGGGFFVWKMMNNEDLASNQGESSGDIPTGDLNKNSKNAKNIGTWS